MFDCSINYTILQTVEKRGIAKGACNQCHDRAHKKEWMDVG